MESEFENIRSYNDEEISAILKELSENSIVPAAIRKQFFPWLPKKIEKPFDDLVKTYFRLKIRGIRTVEQFQRRIMKDVAADWIIKKTSDGVTVSGLENLKNVPHVYVSTHRDILFDSVLTGYVLVNNGFGVPAIAFGDNLMANKFVADLIRANKGFVVKRGLSRREKLNEAYRLSRYIWHLHQQRESVWIAQREGRAKDGDDRTNPSLSKMLYMCQRKGGLGFSDFIRNIKIVPVSIAYEKDPCDVLKARELQEMAEKIDFEKDPEEDTRSMSLSIRRDKGRIHVSFGPVLDNAFENERDVALEIDRSIHSMYKLWPTNYIACDVLNGSEEFASLYSDSERAAFLKRFEGEREEVRLLALEMYARPVMNRQALLGEAGDGFR